jgi:hypothetical protein
MDKRFLTLAAAVMFYAAACGSGVLLMSCNPQSAAIQFKTIEMEGFVKHPKGTEDFHGLSYKLRFTYPAQYADKTVLMTLQQRFISTMPENGLLKAIDGIVTT